MGDTTTTTTTAVKTLKRREKAFNVQRCCRRRRRSLVKQSLWSFQTECSPWSSLPPFGSIVSARSVFARPPLPLLLLRAPWTHFWRIQLPPLPPLQPELFAQLEQTLWSSDWVSDRGCKRECEWVSECEPGEEVAHFSGTLFATTTSTSTRSDPGAAAVLLLRLWFVSLLFFFFSLSLALFCCNQSLRRLSSSFPAQSLQLLCWTELFYFTISVLSVAANNTQCSCVYHRRRTRLRHQPLIATDAC